MLQWGLRAEGREQPLSPFHPYIMSLSPTRSSPSLSHAGELMAPHPPPCVKSTQKCTAHPYAQTSSLTAMAHSSARPTPAAHACEKNSHAHSPKGKNTSHPLVPGTNTSAAHPTHPAAPPPPLKKASQ